MTDVIISWTGQKTTCRPGKFDNNLLIVLVIVVLKLKKEQNQTKKNLKYKTLQKHGFIHVGKESREEKVQLEISEDNRDNQQSHGIAFFDQHCFLSSLNSLPNLFSQYKISLCWRNTNDVSSFRALAKTVAASQHKRRRKNIFQVLDTNSDVKVHSLDYAN